MAWRVAKSIIKIQNQLKAQAPRAVPPATDVNAWGTIGDEDHTNTSDHSPHNFPGWGNEIVTAGDMPHAPALGLDANIVTEAMRNARDPRVKYIIFNRRQTGPNHKNADGTWRWDAYTGFDPHTEHFHLSVVGNAAADGEQPWVTGVTGLEGVEDDMTGEERAWLVSTLRTTSSMVNMEPTWTDSNGTIFPNKLNAALTASATRETALTAAIGVLTTTINALATGGTSLDTAAVITAVHVAADQALTAAQVAQVDAAAFAAAQRAENS